MLFWNKKVLALSFIAFLLSFAFPQRSFEQANTNNSVWSDSCISSSFVGTIDISSQNSFSSFRQVYDYTSGDIIALGSIQPHLPSYTDYAVFGLVMRISKTGVVKWTKFIGSHESGATIETSCITKNKDIVIVTGRSVIRINGSGIVIWQQEIPVFGSDHIYEQIIETSDSGFLMAGPSFYNGIIVKLNSSGRMTWGRRFSLDSYVNCRSIVETTTGYYFEGYSYNTFDNYSRNVLVKMNKQNGDTIWSKSFGMMEAAKGGAEYAYDWMVYKQGKLVITGNTGINYQGPNKSSQSVVTFDEDGNFIEGNRMENRSIATQRSSLFRSRLFDVKTKTGVQYDEPFNNDLYLYRLNDQFKPIWAWKFPMFDREEIEDMEGLSDSSVVLAGKTSTNNTSLNYERALLVKSSKGGMLNNCTNIRYNVYVTAIDVNVAPVSIGNGVVTYDYTTNQALSVFDGSGFKWQLVCASETTCRLGKIEGADTVCTGSTAVFKIRRGGACKNPVSYFTSNPSAKIQPVSDSSVRVQFTNSGKIVLYATMQASCGVLKDSIIINSFSSPGVVNLGSDTSICPGNSILLNAKSGYVSYKWQNGLTDSAIQVTSPGEYSVIVTDACGGIFKDTINVIQEPAIPFSLGPDRTKCNADTIHLEAPAGFVSYSWSPNYSITDLNTQNTIVSPLANTSYFLKAEKKNGCFVFDTITITVKRSPAIYLGADTSFCDGTGIVINAGNNFNTYKWSTGEATSAITISSAGNYSVSATYTNDCISKDTITVNSLYPRPVVSLGTDSTLCMSSSRKLTVSRAYNKYVWNDGSANATYTINSLGTYWVKVVDNNGCEGSDTITVNHLVAPPAQFLPKDTAMCSYGTLELKPVATYQSYYWSNNSTSRQLAINRPGLYWLEVVDANNCTGRDSINVSLKKCTEGFYAPTAFTPNRDAKNSVFRPLLYGNIAKYELIVYNRWGQMIFQTKDPAKGWDGLVNGIEQQTDTFVWYCRYQFDSNIEKVEKGTVMLIR